MRSLLEIESRSALTLKSFDLCDFDRYQIDLFALPSILLKNIGWNFMM